MTNNLLFTCFKTSAIVPRLPATLAAAEETEPAWLRAWLRALPEAAVLARVLPEARLAASTLSAWPLERTAMAVCLNRD